MQRQIEFLERIDLMSLLCVSIIAIGWFGMNTLVVSVGHLTQATRFYELGVVVAHPGALFFGVGSGHGLEVCAFTLLALLTLLGAVAAPVVFTQRSAWLAGWAPLLLMLLVATLLYGNGSSVPPATDDASLRSDVMRLAGHLLQRAQDTVVSHIAVGAGGILSVLASAAMAILSTGRYRSAVREVSRQAVQQMV